ncbi:hypothetical protein BH10PSE2_BH10PSE2_18220 [soil metagenome]
MAYEAKTKPTAIGVDHFIAALPDERRRVEAAAVTALMTKATGLEATMWGPSIIGFGAYHYRYASGHEGDAPLVGFSPRAAKLVFYLGLGESWDEAMLARLGKHKTGKGCLYVNRLANVDAGVLSELVQASLARRRASRSA